MPFLITAQPTVQSNQKKINCNFAETVWTLFKEVHETCRVENQVIDGFGFTFTVQNDREHKFITINDGTVNFLPEKISESFPILQGLEAIRSSVSLLRNSDLENLNELVELNLSDNNLEYIGGHCFKDLQKVELIILRNNKIRFIDERAFENLKSLRQIILEQNELTEVSQFI